jgi:hypothetical protein
MSLRIGSFINSVSRLLGSRNRQNARQPAVGTRFFLIIEFQHGEDLGDTFQAGVYSEMAGLISSRTSFSNVAKPVSLQ